MEEINVDKRESTRLFRERLTQALDRTALSRSEVARRIGVDRSTLTQILATDAVRLPRADTAAALAATLQVSLDWLMGLSAEERFGADILEQSLEISPTGRAPEDINLERWHAEATGFKIRYVPTTLPDQIKLPEVIAFEFRDNAPPRIDQARVRSEERLNYSRQPETDIEVCTSLQSVEAFAAGHGIWKGLPVEIRIKQLEHAAFLTDEMYPSFRWYLFDAVGDYAAPVTIFGSKRAALYVGDMYLVFNTTEHIRVLSRRFDNLIRRATVQAHLVSHKLHGIVGELKAHGDLKPPG
jgi:transcriptional regulator with XRE-family HTH domain